MKKLSFLIFMLLCISIIINCMLLYSRKYENHNEKLGKKYDHGATGQLYYGTWIVTEGIWPDGIVQERYLRIDEEGNFSGVDFSAIIGKEIAFYADYMMHSNERVAYAYGPITYTYAMPTKDELIDSTYYPQTIGLTGGFYSKIIFLAKNYEFIAGHNPNPYEVNLYDLCVLYPKNQDTMYASNGSFMYLLRRVNSD